MMPPNTFKLSRVIERTVTNGGEDTTTWLLSCEDNLVHISRTKYTEALVIEKTNLAQFINDLYEVAGPEDDPPSKTIA